ncbi:hypothetical protein BH11MYX1_BH11MYX1_22810 [soil metagenome]
MRLEVVLSWIAILAACSSSTGTGVEASSPTCAEATTHADLAWIQANVFDKSCVFSGCHTGTAASAGHLNLTAGMSAANLVGVAAQTQPGWQRVVAGDPAASYLLVALGQVAGPMPAGGYMPLGGSALCTEKLDAIERWITAGAQ